MIGRVMVLMGVVVLGSESVGGAHPTKDLKKRNVRTVLISVMALVVAAFVVIGLGGWFFLCAASMANLDGMGMSEEDAMKQPSTDAVTLYKLINVDIKPESVLWKTDIKPGGMDWSLTARLNYSPEQFKKLLELHGVAKARLELVQFSQMGAEEWLPDVPVQTIVPEEYKYEGAVSIYAITTDGKPFQRSPLIHGDVDYFPTCNCVLVSFFTM